MEDRKEVVDAWIEHPITQEFLTAISNVRIDAQDALVEQTLEGDTVDAMRCAAIVEVCSQIPDIISNMRRVKVEAYEASY